MNKRKYKLVLAIIESSVDRGKHVGSFTDEAQPCCKGCQSEAVCVSPIGEKNINVEKTDIFCNNYKIL